MEKRELTTADITLICNSIMEKDIALLRELGPKRNNAFYDRFDAVAHKIADGYVDENELTVTNKDIDRIVRGYAAREAEIFRALLMLTNPDAAKDKKAAQAVKFNGGDPMSAKRLAHEVKSDEEYIEELAD